MLKIIKGVYKMKTEKEIEEKIEDLEWQIDKHLNSRNGTKALTTFASKIALEWVLDKRQL